MKRWCLGIATAASPLLAVAQESTPKVNAAYMVQVFFGLLAIIALIFAIAWFVRRFGQGTLLASSEMRIVGNLPLGAREKVVVVEVGQRQLVLGVTPQQINTLHTFDEPVLGKKIAKEPSDFRQKIQEILGGYKFYASGAGANSKFDPLNFDPSNSNPSNKE